jgi:hypothetical protein
MEGGTKPHDLPPETPNPKFQITDSGMIHKLKPENEKGIST